MELKPTHISGRWKFIQTSYFLLVLILAGVGCDVAIETPQENPPDQDQVSHLFTAFYEHWGGKSLLGKPISSEITENQKKIQWLEKGKMVFDPEAPARDRFSFAPLGRIMGVEEPPILPPNDSELRYSNGHTIHPYFQSKYYELGVSNVGFPLTEARYNPIRRRYEQYFENLGFYKLRDESDVYLLNYGVWACGEECVKFQGVLGIQSNDTTDPLGEIDVFGNVDSIFEGMIDEIGRDFTGADLTPSYTRDGTLEQVFENVVLWTDRLSNPESVRLKSVSSDLNIIHDEPIQYNVSEDNHFVAIVGELGYEIPNYFWEYILEHGGIDITGPPITHPAQLDGDSVRQCFKNVCLIYMPNEIESLRIRPEALGYAYKNLYPAPAVTYESTPLPVREITTLKVWESFPAIGATQSQEINAIFASNFMPVAGIVLELVLTLPDGTQQFFPMQPTDEAGRTSIVLPPTSTVNGSVTEYLVCYFTSEQNKYCSGGEFITWNNP